MVVARRNKLGSRLTVQKLQTTGTAAPDEIRRVGPQPDYVYLPELAADPRGAGPVLATLDIRSKNEGH